MVLEAPTRKFTVDEFHRMGEAGILREDDRVELIRGLIVEMAPIGSRHAMRVDVVSDLLRRAIEGRGWVRTQNPLKISEDSELYPDVLVVQAPRQKYEDRHPSPADVLLLIEVADTSLRYDHATKVPIYAQAGIAEVWIVDLLHDSIEVFRRPQAGQFSEITTATRDDSLSPEAFGDVVIEVHDLLS